MINFAHSEIFMVGAFSGCLALKLGASLPWTISVTLAFFFGDDSMRVFGGWC